MVNAHRHDHSVASHHACAHTDMTAPQLRRFDPIIALQAGEVAEAAEQLAVQSADLAAARGEVADLRSRAAALRKEVEWPAATRIPTLTLLCSDVAKSLSFCATAAWLGLRCT